MANILIIAAGILALALPALAACPEDGTYSTSLNMLPGRASESQPDGQAGQMGNAILAQSWDGVTLGTQWSLACPEICVEPELVSDTVDQNGNGDMIYFTEYCGGMLWLSGDGPWGNGDPAGYSANISTCEFTTNISFIAGQPVLHSTDIDLYGHFEGCPEDCFEFTVAAACQVGEGPGSEFPVGFPLPVHAGTCAQDSNLYGSYWDICCITSIVVGCSTLAEKTSWSKIKSNY